MHSTLKTAFRTLCVGGCFCCLGSLSWGQGEWDRPTLEKVLEKARQILVTVDCVSGFEGFGQSREIPRKVSGLVVSDTGLVMVPQNMEVFESLQGSLPLGRPEKVQFEFVDGARANGEYIGADPDMDVSFFAIDRGEQGDRLFTVPEFSHDEIGLASPLISVRLLPDSYQPRLEVGVARASAVIEKPRQSIRTQPLLTTFKGSPAFTSEGKVVGLVTTEESDSSGDEALAALTGSVLVRPISLYQELITAPPVKLEKGWLGIRMEPVGRDLAEAWNLSTDGGIIVTETIEGSPAQTAGIQDEDVIVAVDGQSLRINSFGDLGWFRQEIRKKKPGDSIRMKVVRGAASSGRKPIEEHDLTVTLVQSPPTQTEAETLTLPEIGLKARALTLDFLFAKRLNQGLGGIVASYVERAGPADIGEVAEDDILLSIGGKPVPDLETAQKVFEELRAEKPGELILHVLRGQNRLFLKVTPEWE